MLIISRLEATPLQKAASRMLTWVSAVLGSPAPLVGGPQSEQACFQIDSQSSEYVGRVHLTNSCERKLMWGTGCSSVVRACSRVSSISKILGSGDSGVGVQRTERFWIWGPRLYICRWSRFIFGPESKLFGPWISGYSTCSKVMLLPKFAADNKMRVSQT